MRKPHEFIEHACINILDILRNVQVRAKFRARRLGNTQELVKFRLPGSLKPLGDIRHDRDRRTPDLISQPKISRKAPVFCYLVHTPGQLPCFLPCNKILESPAAHRSGIIAFLNLSTQHSCLSTEPQFADRGFVQGLNDNPVRI